MGRPAEALASYEQARGSGERLARENPVGAQFQTTWPRVSATSATCQRDMGRPAEALASLEQARAIRERLVRENPSVTEFQRHLGEIQGDSRPPTEGHGSAGGGAGVARAGPHDPGAAARENPSVIEFQNDLAASHDMIGTLQHKMGRLAEALASHERGRLIRERLARENPSVTDSRATWLGATTISPSHSVHCDGRSRRWRRTTRPRDRGATGARAPRVARVRLQTRRDPEQYGRHRPGTAALRRGRAKLTQAVELQRKALAANPNHPQYRQRLDGSLGNLIKALDALGRTDLSARSPARAKGIWQLPPSASGP